MTKCWKLLRLPWWSAVCFAVTVTSAAAQVTPAAGYVPPDDTPAVRVGVTIFADYTVQQKPRIKDVDGNDVTSNAFNLARSYINVTGNISHIVAFRVTPDIARETGIGSSLNGSYTFRLKYAYAQFNLDDWMTRGSWARFGMQQTPWIDFIDTVYRYRFQGTTLEDREGILSSSDVGATFRYVFAGNYGDVHGGIYNGDNYNRAEPNDQKALMVRATLRPFRMHPALRGLRVTGFYDHDAYVKDAERRRAIFGVTYEHPYVNAGINYHSTSDQTRIINPKLDGHGLSVWATPKSSKGWGWEGLLRFDHLIQEQATSTVEGTRDRTIAGLAYWFPRQGTVSSALLLDYELVNNRDYAPVRNDERRWALHALINF
jgi:hypothetical protein